MNASGNQAKGNSMSLKPSSAESLRALSIMGRTFSLRQMMLNVQDFEHINISFSFGGEDLVLRKYLKKKLSSGAPGFYVDIGSADPRIGSNSYLFYAYGWKGVCIDASPFMASAYQLYRPRDAFVSTALGNKFLTAYWHKNRVNTGMSLVTTDPKALGGDFDPPISVTTSTLSEVFDLHVPKDQAIDFFSVDLEGSELTALQSNDWSKYRPEFVMLETLGIDPMDPLKFETVNFVANQGYKCIGVFLANAIMWRVG